MARVFIPTYTNRMGKRAKSPSFHVEFEDHLGIRRRVVAFPVTAGKARSQALGTKLDRLSACRAVNDPLPAELRGWIDSMQPKLREKLVGWGVIDAPRAERSKPMSYQLIGYLHAMKAKGNNPRHIRQTIRKIGSLVRAAGIRVPADITLRSVEAYLTGRHVGRGAISAKTSNAYLVAFKGFCGWLVRTGRLSHNPLVDLKATPVIEEETRWPLSIDEMRTLLYGTASGPVRFGMVGSKRSLLYRVAVETGYRAGELRSLTRACFDLDGQTPTVRLLAGSSKGKRRSSIPLRPDTATLLRGHLAAKAPAARAFDMPDSTHTAEMIRADMIDARIQISDALGRKRDFHNLRHTCGTWLANAGVHPKVIQTIMRHSTFRLTMDCYAHADRDQTTAAMGQLPSLSDAKSAPLAATGTEGACAGTRTNEDKHGQQRTERSHSRNPRNYCCAKEKPCKDRAMGAAGFEPAEA